MVRAKSTVKAPVKERFSMFTRKKTLLIMVYQQAFSYSQKLLGGEINEQIRIGNCLFFLAYFAIHLLYLVVQK